MPGADQAQLDHQFRMELVRSGQRLLLYATWLGLIYIVCRFGYLSIVALAGRHTTADILVRVYAALKIPRTIALLLSGAWAASSTAWAVAERRSKKKMIARMHPLVSEAQRILDPDKGSSNITLRGETAPEDL